MKNFSLAMILEKISKILESIMDSINEVFPRFEHIGQITQNLLVYVKNPLLWFSFSSIGLFFETFLFSEWRIGIGFFFILLIDTGAGSWAAFKVKEFSFKIFRVKFTEKLIVYGTLILAFSISTKMTFEDGTKIPMDYLNIPFYSLLATAEIGSIVKNLYKAKKWPILKKLMDHFPSDEENDNRNETN